MNTKMVSSKKNLFIITIFSIFIISLSLSWFYFHLNRGEQVQYSSETFKTYLNPLLMAHQQAKLNSAIFQNQEIKIPEGIYTLIFWTDSYYSGGLKKFKSCLYQLKAKNDNEIVAKIAKVTMDDNDKQCPLHPDETLLNQANILENVEIAEVKILALRKKVDLTLKYLGHYYQLSFESMAKNDLLISQKKSQALTLLKPGEICFQQNSDCQIIKDQCFLCEGGITPIFDFTCRLFPFKYICSDISSGICGADRTSACIRGLRVSGYLDLILQGNFNFVDQINLGFCQQNKKMVLENNQLVCL